MKKCFVFILLFVVTSEGILGQDVETIFKDITIALDSDEKKKAQTLLQSLKESTLDNGQKYELQLLLKQVSKHQIGLSYEHNSFNDAYIRKESWNLLALEYQYNYKRHSILGRATYSDRFFADAILYEIDAYPVFSKNTYAFVSLATSEGEFFQKFGVAASLFQNVGNGFETEAGFRYFEFETDSFFTFAVGLTKYVGNFYINARASLGPDRAATLAQNYQLTSRYYFENAANYIFVRVGSGIAPNDTARFSQIVVNPSLKAYYASGGFSKWFKQFNLGGSLGVLSEELPDAMNGIQMFGAINVKYRFY